MASSETLHDRLRAHGVSRRGFLKFCTVLASSMALPPAMAQTVATALEKARRPSVIWLSFQECTGCTESLTRSFSPTIEDLIFNVISLDYHHTLQAAAGEAAEQSRRQAIAENFGSYLVVVDGSLPGPGANPGYSTIAGRSNLQILEETIEGAAAVIAVGTCAAFGGIPIAAPNPTGALAVHEVVTDKPVVNVSGCPPVPMAISGVLAHYLVFDTLPELDEYGRPLAFFGQSIHDRCYRRPFYDKGMFARSFDDEGARKGWCLYRLGCKGPMTYNACATMRWNGGTGWPIEGGHPCLGCSEPGFWDGGGFYKPLSVPTGNTRDTLLGAGLVGALAGAAGAALAKGKCKREEAKRTPLSVEELEQES